MMLSSGRTPAGLPPPRTGVGPAEAGLKITAGLLLSEGVRLDFLANVLGGSGLPCHASTNGKRISCVKNRTSLRARPGPTTMYLLKTSVCRRFSLVCRIFPAFAALQLSLEAAPTVFVAARATSWSTDGQSSLTIAISRNLTVTSTEMCHKG